MSPVFNQATIMITAQINCHHKFQLFVARESAQLCECDLQRPLAAEDPQEPIKDPGDRT